MWHILMHLLFDDMLWSVAVVASEEVGGRASSIPEKSVLPFCSRPYNCAFFGCNIFWYEPFPCSFIGLVKNTGLR